MKIYSDMKKQFTALFMSMLLTAGAFSQTTLFNDNFNRAEFDVSAPTTYSSNNSSLVSINTNHLFLSNTSTAGLVYVSGQTSSFATPYQTVLSSNTNQLSWTFNMRQSRSDPSGFDSGNYGVAFVLGATSSDITTANGYAVVLGQSTTTDSVRLVRFANGLDLNSNLTNIISSGLDDLTPNSNRYMSIRVTYDPTTNNWQLFMRDDGTVGFSDPSSGVTNQLGLDVVNATYVNTSLSHFGFAWNYNTAAGEGARFDNLTVSAVPEPASLIALAAAGLGIVTIRRRRAALLR